MKLINVTKKISKVPGYVCLFFLYFLISDALYASEKPVILLINSNATVEKYKVAQTEFMKTLNSPVLEVDLGGKEKPGKALPDNADFVYSIGGKAYLLAKKHFSEKPIIFSSIINWRRLQPLSRKTYGVSSEVHARMPLFMFRSVFPNIKKIGVLYSEHYNLQWFRNAREQARELGITITGKIVSDKKHTIPALKGLFAEVDAIWLISDPHVMPEKDYLYKILKTCDASKMPVFSYLGAFAKIGAVLTVSADNPTIGRQAASIVMQMLSGDKAEEKIQFPAGTHITLNLKKAEAYGLEYNKNALGLVNNIIK